ncbi:MAG: hypothetical protein JSV16_08920, partial [Candidatus Hydrogenedentota bacterium]
PEVLPFYDVEAEPIRKRFGDFVLVNTNFGMVNGFLPSLNLWNPGNEPGEPAQAGTAATGLTQEFAKGLSIHKNTLFQHFKRLIPLLSRVFPDHVVVVRPHPRENHDVWREIAKDCGNVEVVYGGNVLPWLRAAKALIHNGCTTGIEAFMVKLPAIAYRPATAEEYDFDLPNSLSHECFDFDELRETLEKILRGELGPPCTDERRRLLGYYLSALDGPLACDRIVDVLVQNVADRRGLPSPGVMSYLNGWIGANLRRYKKRYIKSRRPGHRNNPDFQRQRFAGVSLREISARIGRFSRQLGRFQDVKARQLSKNVFQLLA